MGQTATELAVTVSDAINSFKFKNDEFVQEMNKEHRTLQQNFTKLCLAWIKHVGSENYHFDDRNSASHETCKELCKTMEEKNIGYLPII